MRIMRNGSRSRSLLVALTVLLLTLTIPAQQRDRAQIPEKYTWDLTHIYPTDAAWRSAKEKLQAEIPQLGRFKGKLASAAGTLADALDRKYAVEKEQSRLDAYASMLADQDTRDATRQGMRQEIVQLAAMVSAEGAYIEPEILRFDPATLQRYLSSEPRLETYRFYLEDISRRAAHTLSDAEERILAAAGPMAGSPSNIHNMLSNADFPYPTVTLSDGRMVRLDQASYNVLRALPARPDRQTVMSSFFQGLGGFSRTFGSTMNGDVQKQVFFSTARKYSSALEAALDGPNIPLSVYMRLIDGVNRNLPAFHRYLKLRKRMLGVDELHYYDLYAPLVNSVQLIYTPEEAQKQVLAAFAPLGSDYARSCNAHSPSGGLISFPMRASALAGTRREARTTFTRTSCSTTAAGTPI
jgi:oligoendopeptidase F